MHLNLPYSYRNRSIGKETMSELRISHTAVSAMGMPMVSMERML